MFDQGAPAEHPWLLPAAIIGVAGLALQGIKAAWDLSLSIKTKANSSRAVRLQETNALLNFIDGLPLDDTKKLGYKLEIVQTFQSGADFDALYGVAEKAIKRCAE